MTRSRAFLVVPLIAMSLALPSASASSSESSSVMANSPNMSHVANLPHKARSVEGSDAAGGSDIEITTISVPAGVDANGNPKFEDRDFALAGSYSNGLQIVDVTDPTKPVTAAVYDCVVQQGDVQVFTREGRTYAAYTMDNGYGSANTNSQCYTEAKALGLRPGGTTNFGTFIADITNPYAPKTVSFLAEVNGSHNSTIAPGGNYIYNSNSDLGAARTGKIEVFDIRDFSAPKKVYTLELTSGIDSHDITFNDAGTRAYSAALSHTLIIDTTNQAEPKVIGRIVDPAINIHHQSDPVTMKDATTGLERTFLVITDELAGAAGNAVCPGGGLHIYDITGPLEQAPVKVGAWFMPGTRPSSGNLTCTSHVLRMYPGQKMMTIAWYAAGVRVVDISGLMGVSAGASEATGNVGAGMKELGYFYFNNSDTWSAKTNRIEADGSMYVYGNDLNRGLDVYRFDGSAPASSSPGRWLNAEQASALRTPGGVGTGPYCLALALGVA